MSEGGQLIITARFLAFVGDENATPRSRLPQKEWSGLVIFCKQFSSIKAAQVAQARETKILREQAIPLGHRPLHDAAIRAARQADTLDHLDDWANSPGLQPPK